MVDWILQLKKMLGSEDESETQPQSGMSKAELRKSNKPMMEKRRRARINQYLDELKNFILVNEKDPTRHSKLEKADILEMTVKRIQTMQRQQLNIAVANDPAVLAKFHSGFSECAVEVSRFVNQLENVDPPIKQRLISHLNKCVNHLQQLAPYCNYYVPQMPERPYQEVKVGLPNIFQNGDENNNGSSARIQIPNGVQLIPSRLPTGELALLVPKSANITANFPLFPSVTAESSARIGQSSAFTTVHRSHSPLLSPSTSTSSCGDESHHSEHPQATSPNPHQPHSSRVKPAESSLPEARPTSSKSFSSSPEAQRPQISSSSDLQPSILALPECKPTVDDNQAAKKDVAGHSSLRQPLSVITDRTSNHSWNISPSCQKGTRKRPAFTDGLLAISNKRARYHQESTSSSSSSSISNGNASKSVLDEQSIDNLMTKWNSPAPQNPNPNSDKFPTSPAQDPNGDMWRPW